MEQNMEKVRLFVAIYLKIVENVTMQCTLHVLNILIKRRRHLKEIILQHLLSSTPPNHLLDLGPILQFSRQREIWMKKRSFDWWYRIVNDHFTDEDWIETFRMTKATFIWLCDQLREKLAPNIKQLGTREPISVEKQVAVSLYFLSSCCEYRIVGNNFGIHKATVWKCIHKVIDAINEELMSSWITMPDNYECHEIAAAFEKKTHIPQLIGAIDGTHIPILPPSDGYRDYINRKGWSSIILQAVVDNNYKFRNIYCGSPGSCHDAAVFQTSQLYKNYNLLIPEETKTVLNVSVPYLIIGDPAYPLLVWLIKGYTKSARLTPEEESFNVYLNSGRVCVEIAFGRLKARWRRLLKRIDVHYTYVPHIVSAACILHNIVETRKETFLSAWEHTITEIQTEMRQPELTRARNLDNFIASQIRDTLKNYLAENFELRRTFVNNM